MSIDGRWCASIAEEFRYADFDKVLLNAHKVLTAAYKAIAVSAVSGPKVPMS